jgi:predicted permease
MVMSTTLPGQHYSGVTDKLAFYDRLSRNLNAIPGVEASAIATYMPPYGSGNYEMQIEGGARTKRQDVGQNLVSADYFGVLRIPLRRGRMFSRQDGPNSTPVAIVNETLAREYFPGADPIGKRVRTIGFTEGHWVTIVGVAATEKHPELMHEMSWREQAALYRPIQQDPPGYFSVAVRASGDRFDAASAIERAVARTDKEVPVGKISAMHTLLGAYLKYPRFRAIVLNQFAGFALLLAALGLNGLLAQYVSRRTREIGLRMAVGARTRDVVRLVAMQAGKPVLAGLLIGTALTFGLTRYLTSLLFGVAPIDPLTTIMAPVALITVAAVAMAKPAFDAASVDPGAALRHE